MGETPFHHSEMGMREMELRAHPEVPVVGHFAPIGQLRRMGITSSRETAGRNVPQGFSHLRYFDAWRLPGEDRAVRAVHWGTFRSR
jgi:hypothetical protein